MTAALCWLAVAAGVLAERAGKWWSVVRFFRTADAGKPPAPASVSILQPILSGDPSLAQCLEENLLTPHPVPVEFVWLVDADDAAGLAICRDLIARHPAARVRLLTSPPPAPHASPKMLKLIQGAAAATGEVVCVLDDDTVLPADALPLALAALERPGVGLAFGLPYYVSFGNLWSKLVAYFVNSHALLTYVPVARFVEPFTINGMFYALRRTTLDAVGGFDGLEHLLADDVAVAGRLRAYGWRLAQTTIRHPIRTTVPGPRAYVRLLQRWFVFPRESLLRGLPWKNRAVVYGFVLLPTLVPLLLLVALAAFPSWLGAAVLAGDLALTYAAFAHVNVAYLRRASPWGWSWLVPILRLILPLQLLAALVLPARINWRGHVMRVERGGTFRLERRRPT